VLRDDGLVLGGRGAVSKFWAVGGGGEHIVKSGERRLRPTSVELNVNKFAQKHQVQQSP